MKALTICQPYAHLICLPDDHDRAKRVENRRWPTNHRGPLLIHAGKSRAWLELDESETRDEEYDIPLAEMTFGAIVGVANLVDCVQTIKTVRPATNLESYLQQELMGDSAPLTVMRRTMPEHALRRFPWLAGHEHVEGPWCWVLTECRRFPKPITYRGAQGLFEVPEDVVRESLEAVKQ